MKTDLKKEAAEIFRKTLNRIKPEKLILQQLSLEGNHLRIKDDYIPLEKRQKVYVIGAGKATARLALGLEQVLGNRIKDGIVISHQSENPQTEFIQVFEGTHPKPDYKTLASSIELLDFIKRIPAGSMVITLFSGGASSLFEVPAGAIELSETRQIYDALLKSGAGIHEMNTVRKAMSLVKGGKTLQYLKECAILNVLISDVPGDYPEFIGSGPTVENTSTGNDALQILQKTALIPKTPESVIEVLSSQKNEIQHTNKVRNYLIGTSRICADMAASFAKEAGFNPKVREEAYDISASELVEIITNDVKKAKGQTALIYHGESRVQVTGEGKGGRNQHVALLLTEKLAGMEGVCVLSAGTDGRDGPTEAAGVLADGTSLERGSQLGMKITDYKTRFDSYHYFKSLNDLIFTGPSGNNVMDIQIILTDL